MSVFRIDPVNLILLQCENRNFGGVSNPAALRLDGLRARPV